MNTVVVNGVTYRKAKDLATKFGYTHDYIGQLCRAGKVECQLIGRTWYVAEDSLLIHKSHGYNKSRTDDKLLINNTKVIDIELGHEKITAPLRNLVHDGLRSSRIISPTLPPQYANDPHELLPQMSAKDKVVALQELRPSAKVSVRVIESTPPKKLHFSDLPVVPLRGTVTVQPAYIQHDLPPPKASGTIQPVKALTVKSEPKIMQSNHEVPEQLSSLPITRPEKNVTSSRALHYIIPLLLSTTVIFAGLGLFLIKVVDYRDGDFVTRFQFDFSVHLDDKS